jgi:hypothetical protein
MKREYLGDSYDAVKRMWQELLSGWAPLHAEPRFLPRELRQDFTQLTRIPMLTNGRPVPYSILNDPDTGIRLPGEQNQTEGRTHISIQTIIDQLRNNGVRCVITYDQSHYRNIELNLNEQRQAKMSRLAEEGLHSFYYVSHAPFLFAVPDTDALQQIHEILKNAGIPEDRLDRHRQKAEQSTGSDAGRPRR